MGVDYYAFAAYGAKVTLKDDASTDNLDQWLSTTGKDLDLGFVEWGSRGYGGDGGFVVGDRRFMKTYDFDDGGDLASLPVVNPPTDTESRIEAAVKRGAPFAREGHGVRWWIGGHVS